MRRALEKECRKQFRQMMAVEFPQFREDKAQIVPPERDVWTMNHPSGLFFHILLEIHPARDQFTTSAAWSLNGRIPSARPGCGGREAIYSEPLLFTTCRLWLPADAGEDHWWKLVLRPEEYARDPVYQPDPVDDCRPLVGPAITEAGEKLKDYLIPAFEEIATREGYL
jgi:hypothetical protein